MTKQQSLLRKSFSILNSVIILVFFAFLLDLACKWTSQHPFSLLTLFIIFPLKVYLFSGIYGTLAELASGKEMVVSVALLKNNVRKFWKPYIAFALFHVAAHPYSPLAATSSLGPFNSIIACIFIYWVIVRKCLSPRDLAKRKIAIAPQLTFSLLALYLLQIALFYPLGFTGLGRWYSLILFASRYIHFLIVLSITLSVFDVYPEIKKNRIHQKEIFLVNPVGGGVFNSFSLIATRFLYPPFFLILKTLTPKHYHFKEFNRVNFYDRYYKSNVLVAISCYTSNCQEAYKIAKEFKKRGATVIMGGPHVTYLSDEALEFCNSVVLGEAEGVWKQVIKDYENGCLQEKYVAQPLEKYYQEVQPGILNASPHMIKDYLEASRGCKYRCDFCTVPNFNGVPLRKKPIRLLLAQIKRFNQSHKKVSFLDNNMYADPHYAEKLFKALKPLKIKWGGQCTIDIARDAQTIQLLKDSGCDRILFGYEIFGDSQEKKQGGKYGLSEKYLQFTKRIKKARIAIKGQFIFGYDSDNLKNLLRLWKFSFLLSPSRIGLSILTPVPGAPMYYTILRENRLTSLNWRNFDCFNLVFQHARLKNGLLNAFSPLLRYVFVLTASKQGYAILAVSALALIVLRFK
ncbi:B12-binding domain-containing radical SAM protein [Candidatus Omnitrophota bacterium]